MSTNTEFSDFIGSIVDRGLDRKQLFTELLLFKGAKSILEVGVWKGEFAQQVLADNPQIKRYYMLDPWRSLEDWNKPFNVQQTAFEEVDQEAMERTETHAARRHVLRGKTTEMIGSLEDDSLDFLYIDGDHTLRGIIVDLVATWPKLRPGGLCICDDFTPSIWQHDLRFEPSMVFPAAVYFAEGAQARVFAIGCNQCVLLKPEKGQEGFDFVDLPGTYEAASVKDQIDQQPLPSTTDLLRTFARKMKRTLKI